MKALNMYYRNIKKALPCSGQAKKRFLQDIQRSVDTFLLEHPDATVETVISHFGTPQQIAAAYTGEITPPELQKKLKIKKWVIGITATAAACALLLWGISIAVALNETNSIRDGYIEVYISSST